MSRGGTCIGMHLVKGRRKTNTNCVYSLDGQCGKLGGPCYWGRCNICKYKQTSIKPNQLKQTSLDYIPPKKKTKTESASLNISNKNKSKKSKKKQSNITSSRINEIENQKIYKVSDITNERIKVDGITYRIGDIIIFREEEYKIRRIYTGTNTIEAQRKNTLRYINLEMEIIRHKK